MSEVDGVRVINELGQMVPDRRPPMTQLVREGKIARRKRRLRSSGALIVALGVGGGAWWTLSPFSGPDSARDGVADSAGSPVISMSNPDNGFPGAGVSGELVMREGCLMIGNAVVFWPSGSTWDESDRSVVFAEDLDADPVRVGSIFEGGGGSYTGEQAASVIGDPNAQALLACLTRTHATGAIFAVPERRTS